MRRREIITSIVSAAGWPFVARAQQQAKVWTVGVLVRASPGSQRFWELFPGLMRERGYVEGQNVRYEFRSDEGDITRLPGLAADLVKLKVDVIVPWFTPAAIAAKQATHDIPIVCAVCGDMVGTDLVSSLARPGGNVTGINGMAAELSGKLVEWIREAMPTARRVAVLVNAPDSFSKPFLKQVQLAGEATGTAIEPIMIQRPEELEAAFAAMEQRRPDAIVVQPSLPTKQVAQLALIHRLPSACAIAPFTGDGGLMAYWGVEVDGYRRAASLVDRVLKGAKPAELPVGQPTKLVLTINLRTAKAIGLTIPQALLQRADEVVE